MSASLVLPRSDNGRTRPALAEAAGERSEWRPRFNILGPEDLLALPPQTWWVDGLLPVGGLAVLYGAPGSGKSFLALAWAIAMAADRPWLGRQTLWSPAGYVAAEGAHGLGVRLRALLDAQEITTDVLDRRLAVIPETVNLMDGAAVADLIAELKEYFGCTPGLVVIDTLSRAMPGGDENSVQDVSAAIAGADAIRRAFPTCCMLILHHTQKTGELERGSSALRGAADTMLALRQEDDRLILEVDKQRNAAPLAPLQLRLVSMGTSCIVELADGQTVDAGLTRERRVVLATIRDVQSDGWAATAVITRNAKGPGLSERSIYRCLRHLHEQGFLDKKASRYALTHRAQSALTGDAPVAVT